MSVFNDSQKRAILSGVLDIHRRLTDLEVLLAQAAEASPFARYVNDLSLAEVEKVRAGFARLRVAMAACLQEHGIPLDVQAGSLRWAMEVGLSALEVAVADMGPERLRGYGPLDDAGRAAASRIQHQLARLIEALGQQLHPPPGPRP